MKRKKLMENKKTETLTFRINPKFKTALKVAAKNEHRSITNMIEVLIRDHIHRKNTDNNLKKEVYDEDITDMNLFHINRLEHPTKRCKHKRMNSCMKCYSEFVDRVDQNAINS
jgi:hypothetical protein